MATNALRELELAALRQDLPAYGLVSGDVGAVVMVDREGEAYEVEFIAADGETLAEETLRAEQVEPLSGRRILHGRDLTTP